MNTYTRKEAMLNSIAEGAEITLEPFTREEYFLKKINEKVANPDWNTLKNKPFYTSVDYELVVSKTEATFREGVHSSRILLDNIYTLNDGDVVRMVFDGNEYYCKAIYDSTIGGYLFGGKNVFKETLNIDFELGNDEPFGAALVVKGATVSLTMCIYSEESSELHDYELYFQVETINTIDPKYIKDMYHEYEEAISIAGFEHTVSNIAVSNTIEELPLELGQKWLFYYDAGGGGNTTNNKYGPCEVKMSDYGELYFGTLEVNEFPFCVTKNSLTLNSNFKSMNYITTVRLVCEEGSITEIKVKQIDEKYIPELSSVILKSSTAGSTKKFKVTVDDSGTLKATEVTE